MKRIQLLCAICLVMCCLPAFGQDAALERGKRIYLFGTGAGKTPVTATLGEGDPIPEFDTAFYRRFIPRFSQRTRPLAEHVRDRRRCRN